MGEAAVRGWGKGSNWCRFFLMQFMNCPLRIVRNSFVKNRRPSESILPSAVVNFQKLLLSNSTVLIRLPINLVFFSLLMHVVNFQQKSGISKCFLTVRDKARCRARPHRRLPPSVPFSPIRKVTHRRGKLVCPTHILTSALTLRMENCRLFNSAVC